MYKTKVSVIIPIYNSEKYLKKCLDSLVNQTLKDIEIIIIDDGSTDKSSDICKLYADDRIKLIKKENQGPGAARNTGINLASGEYIGFTDSDDWVDLNYYEKLYTTAKKHDCEIAVSGIIRLTNIIKKKYHLKFDKEIKTDDIEEKFKLCDIPDKSYVWNKIYKLSEIKKHNLYFKKGIFYEDVIFTPQAMNYLQKMITVPDTFYYYRRHVGSIVTLKNCSDSVDAHKISTEFFKSKNINVLATKTKRYKIFNITLVKISEKADKKSITLFNIIKWQV